MLAIKILFSRSACTNFLEGAGIRQLLVNSFYCLFWMQIPSLYMRKDHRGGTECSQQRLVTES